MILQIFRSASLQILNLSGILDKNYPRMQKQKWWLKFLAHNQILGFQTAEKSYLLANVINIGDLIR